MTSAPRFVGVWRCSIVFASHSRRSRLSTPRLYQPVDEMGVMMNSIKEGGVSLTGQEQPFTHDHFRRSFIRRCKNPVINEKVHTLRTLQSTLKVSTDGARSDVNPCYAYLAKNLRRKVVRRLQGQNIIV